MLKMSYEAQVPNPPVTRARFSRDIPSVICKYPPVLFGPDCCGYTPRQAGWLAERSSHKWCRCAYVLAPQSRSCFEKALVPSETACQVRWSWPPGAAAMLEGCWCLSWSPTGCGGVEATLEKPAGLGRLDGVYSSGECQGRVHGVSKVNRERQT